MTQAQATSRRNLFRGLAQKAKGQPALAPVIRPPGALENSAFIDACSRCGDCISACPEKIITQGDGGFVELNFSDNGCTHCAACIEACPSGALLSSEVQSSLGFLELADNCLAKNSITCQSCKDACDYSAINFPMTAATPQPEINTELCNGCGACVGVCPVNSIAIKPNPQRERVNNL